MSFRGRIPRKVFWLHYALPLWAISFVAQIIDGAAGAHRVFSGLIALALLVPNLAGSVKRLHDRGRSGWFMFILLIPLVGIIWYFIETGCLRGTRGPNRFGADPVLDDRFMQAPAAVRY